MTTIYLLQGNTIRPVKAVAVDGDHAILPLPFGAQKTIVRPRWHHTEDEARAEIARRHQKRVENARKLLQAEGELVVADE